MKRIILAAAAFALVAPLAAHADPGKSKGHGKGHSAAAHGSKASGWTPPGLAKKPHGMPPGQAKKVWREGETLPTQYTASKYAVPEASRANLGPTPYGYKWTQVGDQYVLAQTQTGKISQVLSALAR
ncbi:MAG: RcnB family protein [Phenylobacterium sp.]